MITVSPDAELESADWTKTTWDLPPYKSAGFFQVVEPEDLDAFRALPVYAAAVRDGLIFDDEWVGDYVEPGPDDGGLRKTLQGRLAAGNFTTNRRLT